MIVLITGASHTGKTVLAQKLLEKYNGKRFGRKCSISCKRKEVQCEYCMVDDRYEMEICL